MQQALHIFRKDVRQFRLEGGVLLALLALMTLAGGEPWSEVGRFDGDLAEMLSALAAFAAWFLIGRVMHAEPLPGDRHFWLTRPYRRGALVAAKALYIAAFVLLPLFVAQTVILASSGLLGGSIAGLLWNQLLVTMVFILPAVALASLTRNVVQYALATVAAGALAAFVFGAGVSPRLGPFEWVRHSLGVVELALLAAPIVAIQFLWRRWRMSAAVAAGGAVVLPFAYWALPLPMALGVQAADMEAAPDTFSVALGAPPPVDPDEPPAYSRLRIPYLIAGLADGRFRIDAVQETFTAPSGREMTLRVLLPYVQRMAQTPEGLLHQFYADGGFLESWGANPVRMRATFYVTAFGEDQVTQVPLDGTPVRIAGLGQCGNLPQWDHYDFVCRAGFRLPHGMSSFHPAAGEASATLQPEQSYSPFPAELAILPVVRRQDFTPHDPETGQHMPFEGRTAAITVRKPVAHFRYDLDIPEFRMMDYATPRP
jgi:hypothetical protein